MDPVQFDAMSRSISATSPRRRVFAALAGGLLGVMLHAPRSSGAREKRRQGKRRSKRKDRKKESGTTNSPLNTDSPLTALCAPSCAGRACGDDGCGGSCGACGINQICQGGICACTCPSGQRCLSNGSCAKTCAGTYQCPAPICGCFSNTERQAHCASYTTCNDILVECTGTATCPPGFQCVFTSCPGSPSHVCQPLCPR